MMGAHSLSESCIGITWRDACLMLVDYSCVGYERVRLFLIEKLKAYIRVAS